MGNSSAMGGLVPLWILGAPFLAAVFSLLTTPKTMSRSSRRDIPVPRPAHQPVSPMGVGSERM